MLEKLKYLLRIYDFETPHGRFSVKPRGGRLIVFGELKKDNPGLITIEAPGEKNNHIIYVGKKKRFYVDVPLYEPIKGVIIKEEETQIGDWWRGS